MQPKTKITLSASELELVCNKEWILTKQIIVEKVYGLFGILAVSMQHYIGQNTSTMPEEVTKSTPKISRGENYRRLPYLMLDYPRHFTRQSTLAIRTFFWWGNFFSINLHLAGDCKEKAIPALNANFMALQQNDYRICINPDPWQHHFEEDNYVSLKNYTAASFATILHGEPFIKIAKRIPLQNWDAAPLFLEQHFYEMIKMVQINSPAGETGLSPGIPTTGFDL